MDFQSGIYSLLPLIFAEETMPINKTTTPGKVPVRVIVSKGEKSIPVRAMLLGIINVGDEFIVDDETTGEAHHVQVTSIEVGDKRSDHAEAGKIRTIWARSIEEVVVKISVPMRELTESMEMHVEGDKEFVVGEKLTIDHRKLKIKKIKIREGGFKSREGTAVKARDIKRIYAEAEIRKQIRISRSGERFIVKKRESVWSLKHK